MISKTTPAFRRLFVKFSPEVQNHTRAAYRLFATNPYHPSLHFEKLGGFDNLWSVRAGLHIRAVAVKRDDVLLWFWIGNHADFDRGFSS